MSISENIKDAIGESDHDEKFKALMMEILEKEDEGLSKKTYAEEYRKIVDRYIAEERKVTDGTDQNHAD